MRTRARYAAVIAIIIVIGIAALLLLFKKTVAQGKLPPSFVLSVEGAAPKAVLEITGGNGKEVLGAQRLTDGYVVHHYGTTILCNAKDFEKLQSGAMEEYELKIPLLSSSEADVKVTPLPLEKDSMVKLTGEIACLLAESSRTKNGRFPGDGENLRKRCSSPGAVRRPASFARGGYGHVRG
ncbi:MAG: hypothetical protein U5N86_12595 [Planctomycetota bacterium]|nr:hypothetical protein [Planctomycetota bacterium]